MYNHALYMTLCIAHHCAHVVQLACICTCSMVLIIQNFLSLTLGTCARVAVVVLCVCVCVCVCYRASCYIPHLFLESQVSLGFLWCFQPMYCVDFGEKALFESFRNIY